MTLLCVKWHSYVLNDSIICYMTLLCVKWHSYMLNDSLMCSSAQVYVLDHSHSPMMIDTHQSITLTNQGHSPINDTHQSMALTNQWYSLIHSTHQFSVSIASYWCVYACAYVLVSSCYSQGMYAFQSVYPSIVSGKCRVRIRAYRCIDIYTNIPVFHRSSVPLWNQNWSKRLYPSR